MNKIRFNLKKKKKKISNFELFYSFNQLENYKKYDTGENQFDKGSNDL